MFAVGCHLSVARGYKYMGEEAIRLGASTFQFFTRNPRGGKAPWKPHRARKTNGHRGNNDGSK